MVAREAVLNNAEIVKILRSRFVPIAIDNVDNLNMTAAEKEFLKDKGLKFSTQGMSVFTAAGKLLALGGGFEADHVKQMLSKSLAKYRPEESVTVPPRDEKDPMLRRPPDGGLVLHVTWKVLGDYDRSQSPLLSKTRRYDKFVQDALGVDRLWVRADEAAELAKGTFPESLRKRMIWNVGYVYGGGKFGTMKSFDVTYKDGRL